MARILAQQPQPQPVGPAIPDEPQVWRTGHDQPDTIREPTLPERRGGQRPSPPGVTSDGDAARPGASLTQQPDDASSEDAEQVSLRATRSALGIPDRQPSRGISRRHAEGVGHRIGESGRTTPVEYACQGRQQEAVDRFLTLEVGPGQKQLGEGLVMKECRGSSGCGHAMGHFAPGVTSLRPPDAQQLQARQGLALRWGVQDGRGEQVAHRIAVDAHADAPLQARLQGHRSPAAERIEHHIPWPAPAGDEVMCERRGQAAQIGTHGM